MIHREKNSSQTLAVTPLPMPGKAPVADELNDGETEELRSADEVLTSLKLLTKEINDRKAEKIRLEKAMAESTKELEDANKELIFQNQEKAKRAAELIVANKELIFQNKEKEKRADELIIANKELAFQNLEKEKRADELIIANKELAFQNKEKEKRANELIVANNELAFQNHEKEKRADELVIANKELAFQNKEKEKRADELIIANKELVYQNEEKENRARELIVANKELAFQHAEKEKRAAELIVANNELIFQNEEKEKRAAELIIANKELLAFTYISSHDLQEPLRKIQTFSDRILQTEHSLSTHGKDYFSRINNAARRMQTLIEDLLAYSHTNITERKFEIADLTRIVEEVKNDLAEMILEKKAVIESGELCEAFVNISQFRQVIHNLVANALKFSQTGIPPHIIIKSRIGEGMFFETQNPALTPGRLSPKKNYCHIHFSDNGIGFEPQYKDRIFEVFQRLHGKETYEGTGIGLAIVKKIIDNHSGIILAMGELDKGATFDIYLPAL